MFGKYVFYTGWLLATLSLSVSACADNSKVNCNTNNVYRDLKCLEKENKKLINQLDNKKNKERKDYNQWIKEIKNKCEGKISYASGEGAGLIKNQCYREEYLSRLSFINTGKVKKSDTNIHGLELTYLPYNSNDHLKCIMKKEVNSCSKVNLVKSSNLIKYYPFISPAYGDSIVLPETDDSKQIIVSPFEDNEDEGPQLEISIINAFGVVEQKTISANKNVIIDKNYNLIYKEGNKEKILKLK
ncbi:hypothetical protein SOI76_00570 [Acinetobacter pittii]|uniref:hypothetical protein n=1 Tax=Acinetobacter pittii TaxID=48296 RepID=UPI000CE3DCB2|nr:hypothetical protein [Acinetobacter pittii]PPC04868.1 hypothetical protein ApiMCR8900_11700 [Acinetobacter pittii]WPP59488.1 hypothetical protein SOI76_00570 [Acinetobacter pittii]